MRIPTIVKLVLFESESNEMLEESMVTLPLMSKAALLTARGWDKLTEPLMVTDELTMMSGAAVIISVEETTQTPFIQMAFAPLPD